MTVAQEFGEAAEEWDLETLYDELTSIKGKRLTPIEKLHLRGLLCGYSPREMAEKLNKTPKGVESDLCASVYRYVKSLLDRDDEKLTSWRDIASWLESAGYRTRVQPKFISKHCVSLDLVVRKANIRIEENQILVDINIRLARPLPENCSPSQTEKPEENPAEPSPEFDTSTGENGTGKVSLDFDSLERVN